jgi:hypothetical protein
MKKTQIEKALALCESIECKPECLQGKECANCIEYKALKFAKHLDQSVLDLIYELLTQERDALDSLDLETKQNLFNQFKTINKTIKKIYPLTTNY